MNKNSYAAKTAAAEIERSRAFATTPAGQKKVAYTQREVARIRADQKQSESLSQVQAVTQKQ